jgi:lipopolysaccharide transport system permease protein
MMQVDTVPVLEVRGGPGRLSGQSFVELWVFREVLWAFIVRQVKVKYKQAGIGIGWAVIQPVLTAALFALFLGRLARVPSEGVPYLLFALAGMVMWTYFSAATSSAMESLVANQALLQKIYFPREVLPISAISAVLVDLVIALVTLVIVAAAYGVLPATSWLALPVPVSVLVLCAAAVGVGLSSLNVYYRDVRYALPFILQLGLVASPVIYPPAIVPVAWRSIYEILNPVAAAIDGIRRIVLHHAWPDWGITAGALAWSTLLLVAGYWLFKRLERRFADRI